MKNQAVILPGSYDPVTLGHLDMIRRAAAEYREVYAVIFRNPEKQYTFSLADRLAMLMLATEDLPNVLVSESDGLVIDYAHDHGIDLIIKGYRNETDFLYEKKQAQWNSEHGGIETLLWQSAPAFSGISSTEARKKLKNGEDPSDFLPGKVIEFLKNR